MGDELNIPSLGPATRTPPAEDGGFDWNREEELPEMDKQAVAELIRVEYVEDPLSDASTADVREAIEAADHLTADERQELVEEFCK